MPISLSYSRSCWIVSEKTSPEGLLQRARGFRKLTWSLVHCLPIDLKAASDSLLLGVTCRGVTLIVPKMRCPGINAQTEQQI